MWSHKTASERDRVAGFKVSDRTSKQAGSLALADCDFPGGVGERGLAWPIGATSKIAARVRPR